MSDSATPTGRPCLEVLEGRSRGRVVELVRRHFVIGRSPGVDMQIDDAGVSRRHVRVSLLDDGSVVVSDLRSTNGLFVNGEQVDRAALREGDELRLGPDAVMRFTLHGTARERSVEVPARPEGLDQTAEVLIASKRQGPRTEDLPLSTRQIEVGRLVAAGLTNAAIAERLGISHRTVTSHLDHIYGRLGIGSRAALVRWLAAQGLLGDEP